MRVELDKFSSNTWSVSGELISSIFVLKRGAFHSFEKRTRFFLNKRILTDFSWIFLKNKRIFAKGVRDFWE